jgi:hypothetical protein
MRDAGPFSALVTSAWFRDWIHASRTPCLPSMSGRALQLFPILRWFPDAYNVSMPSMSGRALQRGVSWGSGGDDGFLCPRCRAGLCKGCLPRAAVTWAFGVRRAILAGTLILGKGFGPIPGSRPLTRAFPRANRGPIRLAAASVYRAHVMIQKSWRSSIIRAPRTTTPPEVRSPWRLGARDQRPGRGGDASLPQGGGHST